LGANFYAASADFIPLARCAIEVNILDCFPDKNDVGFVRKFLIKQSTDAYDSGNLALTFYGNGM